MRRSASELRGLALRRARPRLAGLRALRPRLRSSRPRRPPELAAPAPPAPGPRGRRAGSTALAEPREAPLDFVLQPVPGGRSVLAVSQLADERVAWARRLGDGGPGPAAPLRRPARRRRVRSRATAPPRFVTSDGARLCFGASPRARGPDLRRAATRRHRPGGRSPRAPRARRRAPARAQGRAPARPAPKPRREPRPQRARRRARQGPRRAPRKKKPSHAAPARRPSHPLVELFVRWVEPGGAIDAEATTDRPALRGAPRRHDAGRRARPAAGHRPALVRDGARAEDARSPLGSGRLMAASLRADGTLDFASRVAVVDADLEYGQLKDHRAPAPRGQRRGVGRTSASTPRGSARPSACARRSPASPSPRPCAPSPPIASPGPSSPPRPPPSSASSPTTRAAPSASRRAISASSPGPATAATTSTAAALRSAARADGDRARRAAALPGPPRAHRLGSDRAATARGWPSPTAASSTPRRGRGRARRGPPPAAAGSASRRPSCPPTGAAPPASAPTWWIARGERAPRLARGRSRRRRRAGPPRHVGPRRRRRSAASPSSSRAARSRVAAVDADGDAPRPLGARALAGAPPASTPASARPAAPSSPA